MVDSTSWSFYSCLFILQAKVPWIHLNFTAELPLSNLWGFPAQWRVQKSLGIAIRPVWMTGQDRSTRQVLEWFHMKSRLEFNSAIYSQLNHHSCSSTNSEVSRWSQRMFKKVQDASPHIATLLCSHGVASKSGSWFSKFQACQKKMEYTSCSDKNKLL